MVLAVPPLLHAERGRRADMPSLPGTASSDGATATEEGNTRTDPAPSHTGVPPISSLMDEKTETTISGIGMIVGGAMMAAGDFLPWITASTGLGSVSRGGMEGGDGILIAALAGMTILGGIAALLGHRGWVIAIFGSLVGGFIGFLDLQEVQGRVSTATAENSIAVVEVGIGIWLILAGAVVAFSGAFMSWRANRRRSKAARA